jgi:hypothetical protein
MLTRFERRSALVTGVGAVACWIAGIVVGQGLTDHLSSKATDAQVLSWVHDNELLLIVGAWLFMTGCICFAWFAGILRKQLAANEPDGHTFSTIAYGGAVAAAVFGMGTQADIASAINDEDVTAATVRAFHHVGDLFFVGAEFSLIVLLAGVAVVAFQTAAVPRWWGIVGALIAVVLWIGPIGWAAVIFGTPVWVLVTSILLVRRPAARRAAAAVAPA